MNDGTCPPSPLYGYCQAPGVNPRIPPEFYGIPINVLWHWHSELQIVLQKLLTQGQVESVSYSQGDGGRSVTYTRADIGMLERRLRDLGRVLGINRGRRALTPIF
jgi:gpW